MYLLSAGSSKAEDQAALVGDHINCLLQLPTLLYFRNSILVPLQQIHSHHNAVSVLTKLIVSCKQGENAEITARAAALVTLLL